MKIDKLLDLNIFTIQKGIISFLIFMLFSLYTEAIEILVATGINHDPPFVYGNRKISAEFPGVTIDILRLIEKKIGIKFIIKKHPWKRVVHEVKNNYLDGGFHFSFKEERKSFVAYPILNGKSLPDSKYCISFRSYVIYRLKGQSIHWNGKRIVLNSDCKKIIGAIRGCSIINLIQRLGLKLHEINTDEQMLKLLLAKRIDAFIGLENMIDPKINKLAPNERVLIEKSLPPVVNKPYYIGFSKRFYRKNLKIVWKIWKQIYNMKKNGKIQKIFDKYLSMPESVPIDNY